MCFWQNICLRLNKKERKGKERKGKQDEFRSLPRGSTWLATLGSFFGSDDGA